MAQPVSLAGRNFILKKETATLGTYAALCGVKAFSFDISRATTDTTSQDCADSDLLYTETDVGPIKYAVSGSGVVAKASLDEMLDWIESGEAANIQLVMEGTGWQTFAGSALLTKFTMGRDIEGGKVAFDYDLALTGVVTRSTNA